MNQRLNQQHKLSFLIIRPSAIGDIIMATVLVDGLRKNYPDSRISWLVEQGLEDVIKADPRLDRVIAWPKKHWKNLLKGLKLIPLAKEILQTRQHLSRQQFDLALDAQGLLRSRLLAFLSGAPMRLGFRSKEPGERLMTRIIDRGPSTKFMGQEYLRMLESLGINTTGLEQTLFVPEEAEKKALDILHQRIPEKKYAVFLPFTTRPQKHWIDDYWQGLAMEIQQLYGLSVVLLGGKEDVRRANQIVSNAACEIINLAGVTSLAESLAVIKNAGLAIGVDTGLTHAAICFDRPTIAIFGSTCPFLHTPKGDKAIVIHSSLPCSPCKRHPTCTTASADIFDCMTAITPDMVIEKVQNLCMYFM